MKRVYRLNLYVSSLGFEGINRNLINVLGRLKQKVKGQNCEIFINFLIVPQMTMSCEYLLGRYRSLVWENS